MPPYRIFLRYWGSYFKSARHAETMTVEFEALVERGWQCHLVVERLPEDLEWLNGMHALGISLSCQSRPKSNFDLQTVMRIRSLCLDTGCTVFHCDNMHMSPLIGAALAGVPVRIWCKHAMNSHYEACRKPGVREKIAISTRLSAMLATRVIAVSKSVASDITGLGFSDEKVFVLNNPRPDLRTRTEPMIDSRRRLGISAEAVVFISIGRAEKVKGWDMLLKAFVKLAKVDPRAHLLMLGSLDVRGEDSFWKEIEPIVETSDVADRIHFTGHVTDVHAKLSAGNVFVLPSRSEGCCQAMLEALELGLPCVATRVGNAAEVLEESGSGLLVEREDVQGLASAMKQLLVDEDMRSRMAENACIPSHVPDIRDHGRIKASLYESLLVGERFPSAAPR